MLLSVLCSGCSEEGNRKIPDVQAGREIGEEDRIVLGEKLENPYSLTNMQAAYDELVKTRSGGENIKIEVSDLYVRFLPKDSSELKILQKDTTLELFDYPLDRDIVSAGSSYHDPAIPEGEITWQYTTVKPDYKFPGIKYEILEKCFIPWAEESLEDEWEDEDTKSAEPDFLSELEYRALERAGTLNKIREKGVDVSTKGWFSRKKPKGHIYVYDDELRQNVGVKGVKVRCNLIVKWVSTYTDENGYYRMPHSFRIGPFYAVIFNNRMDFSLWATFAPVLTHRYLMGFHSKRGHDHTFGRGSNAWKYATVNNAAYEYYSECHRTGITPPPDGLKIWVWRDAVSSSTPMLRRIWRPIGRNSHSAWSNFFSNIGVGLPFTVLNTVLKILEPDITLGTKNKGSLGIYEHVNHELSHASHFRQAGSYYWSKYIDYIITYGAYGDGHGNNSGICGVGEMWGFAMGYIQVYEKYNYYFLPKGNDYWFKPKIIWDIYINGILTKKQIFDCLTRDVKSHEQLKQSLITRYPGKKYDIIKIFNDYGF